MEIINVIAEAGSGLHLGLQGGLGCFAAAIGVGFVPHFHHHFEHAVRKAYTAKSPGCACCAYDKNWDEHCAKNAFASMETLIRAHHEELAGVILEPLCQGAAGIRIYPAEYLRQLRALCDEYGLLLIADEIAVGFARTGSMFACEEAGVTPDILCLGKALTGGYLPMSAAIVTDEVYDAFRNHGGRDCTFYDGHTYCGNPITSAVAIAALELYTSDDILSKAKGLEKILHDGMAQVARHPAVHHHKCLGMIGMCAVTEQAGGADFARQAAYKARELGLFIRPLGDVLYLWPPLVATESELNQMVALFGEALG